jgi:hypothetical protein
MIPQCYKFKNFEALRFISIFLDFHIVNPLLALITFMQSVLFHLTRGQNKPLVFRLYQKISLWYVFDDSFSSIEWQ